MADPVSHHAAPPPPGPPGAGSPKASPVDAPSLAGVSAPSSQSFAAIARRQFLRNHLAVGGLVVVVVLATVAVWCPLLATDQPYYIRTVFQEDYENAYYSSFDLMKRLERFGREGLGAGETPADIVRSAAQLRDRLGDVARSLAPDAAAKVLTVRGEVERRIKTLRFAAETGKPAPAASWGDWRSTLETVAAPSGAALGSISYYPAFKSVGGMEVFFMVFWLAGVGVWATGFWRRGGKTCLLIFFVPALFAGTIWRIANPPVIDTTDYRALIERPAAPVTYLRAPVAYGENENLTREANQAPTWLLPPEKRVRGQHSHLLGTDPSGRDVLARMIYGTRISMLIGIVAVSIYISIGIVVGSVAGYFRGWVDIVVSRVVEIVICFPTLFLLLILLAYIRPNIYTIMAALGLISWTGVARLERGEFLRLVNQDFVQAVRALGGGPLRIIFRHILPNALGPVLVSASFGIAGSILAESTLSFLGFGVPPDQASWGGLLKIGNENIRELWWLVLFPGVALFTTVTCFNLVGEGVRDATDPRLIQ